MNEPLHPLTLSEILDRTAHIYRSRFLVFFGIGTLPAGFIFASAAGIFAFLTWMGSRTKHGATVPDASLWIFLTALLVVVVPLGLASIALGEAAMTDAAARTFLGEGITIRGAYKTIWKRGWRYIGLYTWQILAITIVPGAVFLIAMFGMIALKVSGAAANDNSPLFGGLLVVLMIILGAAAVWILLHLCLAFPVSVVEQTTAWTSLKRSTLLSNGTRARMLLLYVLGAVLNQILSWCLMVPIIIALSLIPSLQGQAHAKLVGVVALFATYGSFFAVKTLIKPLYGIAFTLFYFDQRIRKEGFDIEWMMQQAGMLVSPPAPDPVLDSTQVTLLPDAQMNPAEIVIAAQEPACLSPREVLMERTPGEGNA
ncbi:hypothetical protein P8935_00825 [Telmatobacter sp. DSM 110680]|uniref:Glycerophosphoryl diester phosphodiesterase membrane domain-containing protein n=1 Tax=Telmatobacter sp. DSM 110680 TaxID=3036704 RepID=A0AAU7DKL7_9BACT